RGKIGRSGARDRCSHTNLTIHAEFRSGSRDIDNPPFFASRSEKNIGRSPVLKRAGFLHKPLPQSDLPVGIDSGKRLSKFTTLEGEGLSCGGVDGSSLPWAQVNPNTSRGLGFRVISIPDYRLNIALTVARNEKSDDVLLADGHQNRLVRSDRARFLDHFIGERGRSARTIKAQAAAIFTEVRESGNIAGSPFGCSNHYLSLERSLASRSNSRCGFCHMPTKKLRVQSMSYWSRHDKGHATEGSPALRSLPAHSQSKLGDADALVASGVISFITGIECPL